jgi:phage terminase small subunit
MSRGKIKTNIRRKRFVEIYVGQVIPDGKAAAIAAGYSVRSAKQIACWLLNNDDIKKAVAAAAEAKLKRIRMSADDVLVGLAEIASVDPAELYDKDGKMLPVRDMPAHVRRAISGIEPVLLGTKIKFWDKKGALDTLAKHHKLLTEKLEISDPDGNAIPMFQIVFESPKKES